VPSRSLVAELGSAAEYDVCTLQHADIIDVAACCFQIRYVATQLGKLGVPVAQPVSTWWYCPCHTGAQVNLLCLSPAALANISSATPPVVV
jgi:hypothetical protein